MSMAIRGLVEYKGGCLMLSFSKRWGKLMCVLGKHYWDIDIEYYRGEGKEQSISHDLPGNMSQRIERQRCKRCPETRTYTGRPVPIVRLRPDWESEEAEQ